MPFRRIIQIIYAPIIKKRSVFDLISVALCRAHLSNYASVEGPGFESRCLLTTEPLCQRYAPTCLKTESKLVQYLQPADITISLSGPRAKRVTNVETLVKILIKNLNLSIWDFMLRQRILYFIWFWVSSLSLVTYGTSNFLVNKHMYAFKFSRLVYD